MSKYNEKQFSYSYASPNIFFPLTKSRIDFCLSPQR
ncbi:hypothetical protein CLBKND_03634 [Methylorubrum aminovorans]